MCLQDFISLRHKTLQVMLGKLLEKIRSLVKK